MDEKAKYYIEKLKLTKHPEGGYFNEIYRSGEIFEASVLPERYKSSRTFSTSIYFLLEGKQFSSFHRLQSDEIWHFYDGCSVKISVITANRKLEERVIGNNLDKDESLQTVVEKNSWFGAELADKNSFALVGCTVAPGFSFEDFEIGDRDKLMNDYPEYSDIIFRLTKVKG